MMDVDNIITFDAHDPRVQNAIPLKGFENVQPAYQMIKALVNHVDNLKIDREHLMIISPDEGGMSRCIYYALCSAWISACFTSGAIFPAL